MMIYKFVVPDMRRDDIVAFGKTEAEAEELAEKLWVILNEPLLETGWGQETWEEAKEYYSAYCREVPVPSVWHCDEIPLSEL
jgi:hypothetical protein